MMKIHVLHVILKCLDLLCTIFSFKENILLMIVCKNPYISCGLAFSMNLTVFMFMIFG